MTATIDPEPPEDERDAILAALMTPSAQHVGWAETALIEGVEEGELDP